LRRGTLSFDNLSPQVKSFQKLKKIKSPENPAVLASNRQKKKRPD
jgi:hypothetical protein